MKIAAVEPWVEAPLKRYVDDARARLALLLHPTGQVMAQAGFTREVDVMTACALASAIHATAGELGRQVEGRAFGGLHYAGPAKQMYLAPLETSRGSYICFTVFDDDTSLGLIRIYFQELGRDLAAAALEAPPVSVSVLAGGFEAELNRNLSALFRPRDRWEGRGGSK
jgi:hypothetical protein